MSRSCPPLRHWSSSATATWSALSGHPVHTGVFDDAHLVPHVKLGQETDLVVVAPATADLLARAASGRADDLLTNVLLTTRAPVIFAPAMHTEMWLHPGDPGQRRDPARSRCRRRRPRLRPAHRPRLRARTPAGARGAVAVVSSILAEPRIAIRAADRDLAGLRVAVSAGGTREHLDPVRFLGNRSSGRMGWALARAAGLRGAAVHLVAAHVSEPPPANAEIERVGSTADLAVAMRKAATDADIVVMAAAPADFTPASSSESKIKKSE